MVRSARTRRRKGCWRPDYTPPDIRLSSPINNHRRIPITPGGSAGADKRIKRRIPPPRCKTVPSRVAAAKALMGSVSFRWIRSVVKEAGRKQSHSFSRLQWLVWGQGNHRQLHLAFPGLADRFFNQQGTPFQLQTPSPLGRDNSYGIVGQYLKTLASWGG